VWSGDSYLAGVQSKGALHLDRLEASDSIHTNNFNFGSSHSLYTVKRRKRGKHGQEVIPALLFQKDYAKHVATVDQNKRDSRHYITLMQTNWLSLLDQILSIGSCYSVHLCCLLFICLQSSGDKVVCKVLEERWLLQVSDWSSHHITQSCNCRRLERFRRIIPQMDVPW
jgi:hypothetical protein